jgi:hypothetical protein
MATACSPRWCVWIYWAKEEKELPIPPFADEEEEPVAENSDPKSLFSPEKKNRLGLFERLIKVRKYPKPDGTEEMAV